MPAFLITFGLRALGIGKALWRIITSDWRHIVIAALAVLAVAQYVRLGAAHRQIADRDDAIASYRLALETTTASLRRVTAALNAKNAETDARGRAYREASTASRASEDAATRAYRATQHRIDAVRAAVGQNGEGCGTPADVREALP